MRSSALALDVRIPSNIRFQFFLISYFSAWDFFIFLLDLYGRPMLFFP